MRPFSKRPLHLAAAVLLWVCMSAGSARGENPPPVAAQIPAGADTAGVADEGSWTREAYRGEIPLEQYQGHSIREIYCTGNGRTRESVILQEVLLEPGNSFDAARARETMRNLRALEFLSAAEIIPHPIPELELVDLEVAVEDNWPWVGAVIPSVAGGQSEVAVIAANGNFRGTGQSIGFFGLFSNEVTDSYSVFFQEPRVLGSRWGTAVQVGRQGDDGNLNGIEVTRPLYSLSTRWGYHFSAFDRTSERILYQSGVEVADFFRERRGGSVAATRIFGKEDRRFEITGRGTHEDDVHHQETGWSGVIPENKRRSTVTLEVSAERLRFVEDRFIRLMGPVEDFRLGLRGILRLGGAAEFLGSDRSYPELGAGFRWMTGSPSWGYLAAEAGVDTRFEEDKLKNTRLASNLRVYRKILDHGLIAAQGRFDLLDEMEDPDQLLLDSPNGLRGFEANSFEGTRRLVANLEWRQPLFAIAGVVLGTAVFTDGGIIWSPELPLRRAPFQVGVGAGLRFGFAGLLGAPVMRLDLGYGLRPASSEVSFGFEQRF